MRDGRSALFDGIHDSKIIDGSYNGGNTVAKYQSTDNGLTWNYIEQLEKEVLTTIK